MGFGSQISDFIAAVSPSPQHPHDAYALLPFVGVPFGYNAMRQGRVNWGATVLGTGIGIATSEFLWLLARDTAFTRTEWMLGRALHTAGVTYGGRSYFGYMLRGTAVGAADTVGWRVPTWAVALGYYEYGMWFGDKVSSAQPGSSQFWEAKYNM